MTILTTSKQQDDGSSQVRSGPSILMLLVLWGFGAIVLCGLCLGLKEVVAVTEREESLNRRTLEATQLQQKQTEEQNALQLTVEKQIQAARNTLDALAKEKGTLEGEIKTLTEKRRTLSQESESLAADQKQLEVVRTQLATAGSDRTKLDEQITALDAKLSTLVTQHDELQSSVATLSTQEAGLKKSVAELKQTQSNLVADLGEKAGELADAEREVSGLEQKISAAKKTLAATQTQLVVLVAEEARINALLQKHAMLQTQVESLEADRAAAETEKVAAQTMLNETEKKLADAKLEVGTQEQNKSNLMKAIELLKQEQAIAELAVKQSNQAATDLETKKKTLADDIKRLTAVKTPLDATITGLKAQEAGLNQESARIRLEVSDLELKLDRSRKEFASLADVLEQMRPKVASPTAAPTEIKKPDESNSPAKPLSTPETTSPAEPTNPQ